MEWVAAVAAALVTIATGFFGWLKLRDSSRMKGIEELLQITQVQLVEAKEQIRLLKEELKTAQFTFNAGQTEWDKEKRSLLAELVGLRSAVARLEIGSVAAIVVVDATGDITDMNPMATELTGWNKEELMGKDLRVLIPFRFRFGHTKAFGEVRAGKRALRKEPLDTFLMTRTGTEVPVQITLNEWEDDGKHFYAAELRRRTV